MIFLKIKNTITDFLCLYSGRCCRLNPLIIFALVLLSAGFNGIAWGGGHGGDHGGSSDHHSSSGSVVVVMVSVVLILMILAAGVLAAAKRIKVPFAVALVFA